MKKIIATSLLTVMVFTLFFSAMGASFGAGVKSIQQGTGTESVGSGAVDTVNVTITATVLAKTEVRAWAASTSTSTSAQTPEIKIAPVLTSTTNLRLFMSVGGAGGTITYTWQVVEYY